jgi:hypothetical protein
MGLWCFFVIKISILKFVGFLLAFEGRIRKRNRARKLVSQSVSGVNIR